MAKGFNYDELVHQVDTCLVLHDQLHDVVTGLVDQKKWSKQREENRLQLRALIAEYNSLKKNSKKCKSL